MSARDDKQTLQGRCALVTGASSGIGCHIAHTLAAAGAAVAVTARRRDRIEDEAQRIRDAGGRAIGIAMDVTERASVEAAVAAAEEQLGPIDILVNNAGVARTAAFLAMTEDEWNDVLQTSLSGVWRVGQVVARSMAARGRGSIINITSIAAFGVQSHQANYSAAKAGVVQLTRVMAYELARSGVRVNALAPGYLATEMTAEFIDSDSGRKYIERLVPGRLANPSELDGPVLLLASDAGSFMTGTVLTVDGGAMLKGL